MHLRANLYALLTAVFWGGSFVCIRILRIQEGLTSVELFVVRFLPSAALMLLVWWVLRRRTGTPARMDWQTWGWVLAAGALSGPLYHLPLYVGSAGLGAGLLSILVATTPVQTLVIEIVLGQRRPTWPYVGGILLAVAGALILVFAGQRDADAFAVRGWTFPLWVLLAAFFSACFTVISKHAAPRLGALRFSCLTVAASIMLVPWLWPRTAALGRLSGWQGWTALLYLVLAATVVATVLWIKALRDLSASQVCIYLYVTTAISSVLGWLLLGEYLGPSFFVAAACIMAGIWLVNRRPAAG